MTPAQLELVTLDCPHCGFIGVPTLMRSSHHTKGDALGAYCGRCKKWLKWVRLTSEWLALEALQEQSATPFKEATPAFAGQPRDQAFWERTINDDTTRLAIESEWIKAISEMGRFCWEQSESMGWHENPRSTLERAMLVVTELSELSEAARHDTLRSPSEHIPEFTQAEEEWADVMVRVFDHSPDDGVSPLRLGQAFVAKLKYNRTRGYKHGGKTI